MATLHFGVDKVPYPGIYKIGTTRGGRTKTTRYGYGMTTTDVAKILEAHYHVMEIFEENHRDELRDLLDVPGVVKRIIKEGSVPKLTIRGQAKIKAMFKQFLMSREMDGLLDNVPTDAANLGIAHRLLHPYYKSNPPRPSFVDTRLYMNSFKAWVTE